MVYMNYFTFSSFFFKQKPTAPYTLHGTIFYCSKPIDELTTCPKVDY